MFSLMRYCCIQLIHGIGNLSFLLAMHEAPLNINSESDMAVNNDKMIIDQDNSSLISENESQTNEINLEADSIEATPTKNTEDWKLVASDASNVIHNDIVGSPYFPIDNKEGSQNALHFNDTLEEVEYMMEQGLKILNKNECDSTISQSHKKNTISSKYDDVKSPISMYIKDSPLTPLRRNNIKHQCLRLETLRESSIICNDDNSKMQMQIVAAHEKRRTFPRKAYINSSRMQITYENVSQRKDGIKMQKLFGDLKNSPTVIKHYGRLRAKTFSQRKENIPIEDSFRDFSMDSGDISVHVVKNAKWN